LALFWGRESRIVDSSWLPRHNLHLDFIYVVLAVATARDSFSRGDGGSVLALVSAVNYLVLRENSGIRRSRGSPR
jgi:hypothetical protein